MEQLIDFIPGIIGFIVGLFGTWIVLNYPKRAKDKLLDGYDPGDHKGYVRVQERLLRNSFLSLDDAADLERKLTRMIAELNEYTVRNVNKHVARNAREDQKEEEEALKQQILEFGLSNGEPVEGQELETAEPRNRGRGKGRRLIRNRN